MKENVELATLRDRVDEKVGHELKWLMNNESSSDTKAFIEQTTEFTAGLSDVKNIAEISGELAAAITGEAVSEMVTELIASLTERCEAQYLASRFLTFEDINELDNNKNDILSILVPSDKNQVWYSPMALSLLQCIENSYFVSSPDQFFRGPSNILNVGTIHNSEDGVVSDVYCFITPPDSSVVSVALNSNDIYVTGYSVQLADNEKPNEGLKVAVTLKYNPSNITLVRVKT